MHLCSDELTMILASVPFIGTGLALVRTHLKHFWCKLTNHKKHTPEMDRCDKCLARFEVSKFPVPDEVYGLCDDCALKDAK